MLSRQLSEFTYELANLVCLNEELHIKLIKSKADLQEYEKSLFTVIIADHSDEVNFIEDLEVIESKLDDPEFLDGIYSTVNEGVITFYDMDSHPLITYEMLHYNFE